MSNEKMTVYEFYRRVGNRPDYFVAALPERRKIPSTITNESIMNWGRLLFREMDEEEFRRSVYFIVVKI